MSSSPEYQGPVAPPLNPAELTPEHGGGTNGLAVTSFVMCFCAFPVALVLAIIALVQIRRTGEKGRGFAIATLSIGAVYAVVLGTVFVVYHSEVADRDPSGVIATAGIMGAEDLRTGDCVAHIDEHANLLRIPVVPCSEPHTAEVIGTVTMTERQRPSDDELDSRAVESCSDLFDRYAPADDHDLSLFYLAPPERQWHSGNQPITCIVALPSGTMTGSLKD